MSSSSSSDPLAKILDSSLASSNKKIKEAQQTISSIQSGLQKEKVYGNTVIKSAIAEYLEYLDGDSISDRLVSFTAASDRKINIRRLALKSFLRECFNEYGIPYEVGADLWARLLFNRIEVRPKDTIKSETLNHFKILCQVVVDLLKQSEYSSEELAQSLDSRYLSNSVWVVYEINRRAGSKGAMGKEELNGSFRTAADVISRSKRQPIDLLQILEIFGSAPHKFIQTIPVLMRPQLERMHHPTVMECLRKSLIFVSDNLEWDYENMPTTIENIKKHPGIPIATEVAKCMSFGDLYDVIIRVITKLVLGEKRGFDKCESKLRLRLEDESEEQKQFLHIREFRVLFGLAPEAYDRKGEPVDGMSEKSRAHSFIASVILIPFLRGLYEARGKHFDLELSVDALFRSRTEEVKEAREDSRSLDEKRKLRKVLVALRKNHTALIDKIKNSKLQVKEEFEKLLSTTESLGMDRNAVFSAVTSDISKLKKTPKKKISEARMFLEMAKEAPDGTEGLPPSPWGEFFGGNLKTISKALKAAGTAIVNLDMISKLISNQLVDTLSTTLPIKPEARKPLSQMAEFRTVVQVSWENARGRLPVDINNRLVELLKGVHSFTRAKPKAKSPEHLCLKLLGLTRPFVQEYFRCLYEVNGQDLYMTIVTLTEDDLNKLEKTKAKAHEIREEALERATGRRRDDLEM